MLELNFEVFWDHYEKQNRLKNEDRRKLHYEQRKDSFKLYLKSVEYWEYFTVISFDKIAEFGGQYEVDQEQAIKDFKNSFLHGTMPIKETIEEVENLPISKQVKSIEEAEAKPYHEFLESKFAEWERKILSFLDETLQDEVINKSFGDFMRRLFNVVNTADFRTKLKSSIKKIFKDGIEEAELEVNVDVGFDRDFEKEVNIETTRQLDGFFIDGKPWAGLKGVSEDLQLEIREKVVEGIVQKQTMKDIKKQLKDVMVKYKGGTRIDGNITDGRAMKIARTESNRMRNSAKLKAYNKSGLIGLKKWNSFVDSRTSDICKRLDNQEQPLDKPFVDINTGKTFDHPPAHPNCRSAVEFVLK